MPEPAASTASERYQAIEQAYSACHWGTVVQQGRDLMRELAVDASPNALALRQRLELMLGHTQLYGFQDTAAAEDHYRSLLNQRCEPSLRQLAEQGLQHCRGLEARSKAQDSAAAQPPAQVDSTDTAAPGEAGDAGAALKTAEPDPALAAPQESKEVQPETLEQPLYHQRDPADGSGQALTADPAPAPADEPAPGPTTMASSPAAPWLADLTSKGSATVAASFLTKDPFQQPASPGRSPGAASSPQPRVAAASVTVAAPEPMAVASSEAPEARAGLEAPSDDDLLQNSLQASSAVAAELEGSAAAERARQADLAAAGDAAVPGPEASAEDTASSPLGADPEPSPADGADSLPPVVEETLIPEVIEEPELIEVHQADPRLAEELVLSLAKPGEPEKSSLTNLAAAALAAAGDDPVAAELTSADDPDSALDADLLGCLRLVQLTSLPD